MVGFVPLHPPYIRAKMGSLFIGNPLNFRFDSDFPQPKRRLLANMKRLATANQRHKFRKVARVCYRTGQTAHLHGTGLPLGVTPPIGPS